MIVLRVAIADATKCKGFSLANCEPKTYVLVYHLLQEAAAFVYRRVL